MHDVTIRSRADGITELRPTLAPLAPVYRVAVIGTVLLITGGLFLSGIVPPEIAAPLAASCLVGDLVLAVRALLLRRRPAAPVVQVASYVRRRRAAGR